MVNGGQLFTVQNTANAALALNQNAVAYDTPAHTGVTLNPGGPAAQIHNVAAGTAATDAVNLGQAQALNADTLNKANAYTDTKFADIQNGIGNAYSRISRVGAMGAAMAQMASAGAGLAQDNRIAFGTGLYDGQVGMSVGYQHRLDDNVNVTVGGAFSGSEATAGAGIALGW